MRATGILFKKKGRCEAVLVAWQYKILALTHTHTKGEWWSSNAAVLPSNFSLFDLRLS